MSVGHDKSPLGIRDKQDSWEKLFLAHPIPNKPGTKFVYCSMATYMLSSIVRKTTGENLMDYLKPRLFEPLRIEGVRWESSPNGTNVGGWGMYCKTEDMAKLGQLLLQKGKWNNKQLLPEAWIEEATKAKILQDPTVDPATSDSDWTQGYGYQIWLCRRNAYRAEGRDCQFVIVMPDQKAVVVMTSLFNDNVGQLNLVWDHLFPALK
jgi:CubicO group peptidase (beta-lactamase class C family)